MQRHVNDWVGTLKAAIPFLQIMQCHACAIPKMQGKDKELAAVLDEARDIVEAAEATLKMAPKQPQTLVQELTSILNRRSLENGSNTPDFILADFLSRCLVLFDDATNARSTWYGQPMKDLEFNKVADITPDTKWEADAMKKRQFPVGGVVDGMKKAMARGIMEDIEKKTAETLHGFKQTIEYVQGPLWEEFNQTNAALAKMWDEGQRTTQEYKDLQKKANELAAEIGKVKKEAIEKEGADKMARMVADVMRVADGFVVAAKAIQVFNREAKEADAIRKKVEHMEPKTGDGGQSGKKPIVDEKGFLFISGNGDILWALHDGVKYCFCNWEGGEWVGWRVVLMDPGAIQTPYEALMGEPPASWKPENREGLQECVMCHNWYAKGAVCVTCYIDGEALAVHDLNDINTATLEGRLLMAALAKITTESQRDKTPWQVIEQLNELKRHMYDEAGTYQEAWDALIAKTRAEQQEKELDGKAEAEDREKDL